MSSGVTEFPFRTSPGQWGRWKRPALVLPSGKRKCWCGALGRQRRQGKLSRPSKYLGHLKNINTWAPPQDNWIKLSGASVFVILKADRCENPHLPHQDSWTAGKCFSFLKTKTSKSYRTFNLRVHVNVTPYISISSIAYGPVASSREPYHGCCVTPRYR